MKISRVHDMIREFQVASVETALPPDTRRARLTNCYDARLPTNLYSSEVTTSMPMPQLERLAALASPDVIFNARCLINDERLLGGYLEEQVMAAELREKYNILQEAYDKYKALVALHTSE